jgi:phosphatidylserine/phosphatidylglycerophosphate/cardiolipin synthase-like enzyme
MGKRLFGIFIVFVLFLSVIGDAQGIDIADILQLPIGQKATVQGKIVAVHVFRAARGRTLQITDDTGSIDVLIWSDLFYLFPHKDSLAQGTVIQVEGRVDIYQGRLQIRPEKPGDIQILSITPVPSVIETATIETVTLPISDVEFLGTGSEIYTTTFRAVKEAKKSIYVVMFIMRSTMGFSRHPVTALISELIAAKKRGVEVHVILDETVTLGKKSISQDSYTMLWESGIDVRFDSPDKMTHTKLVVIDDSVSILGSNNWSKAAFRQNDEAAFLVRSPAVAKKFKKHIESIKVEYNVKDKEVKIEKSD